VHFLRPSRSSSTTVAVSIVLLLLAMMLPVCHLHPLLDKGAPDHCTICVSLHAAVPFGVHLQLAVRLFHAGPVFLAAAQPASGLAPLFRSPRAPPAAIL
jgi:hypothetical protein